MGRLKGIFLGLCVLALFTAGGASAATWWHPPQQLTWYWQLSGTPKIEPVMAIDIDGFDNGAAEVAKLHAVGQRAICYIDVGTSEDWRSDFGRFPASVQGNTNGWPGEKWLDVGDLSTLEPIMAARFEMCQAAGFDAVEPDNMDGYENATGFPITAAQQATYNEWIAGEVHSLGMAVFEKNDPDQAAMLEPYFDGVIDEQCNEYSECSAYKPFLSAGKPVLNAEYTGGTSFCAADNAAGIMGALYALALDGSVYQPCFGPSTTTPITGGPAAPPGAGSPTPPSGVTNASTPPTGVTAAPAGSSQSGTKAKSGKSRKRPRHKTWTTERRGRDAAHRRHHRRTAGQHHRRKGGHHRRRRHYVAVAA